jgi:thioesterase domain-containing protein
VQRQEPIPVDDPARHVVRFHEAGASTPMIVLNNRSVYYPLARELGEDRPFTDIQLYHPASRWAAEAHRFEELATHAIHLIRSVQPKGPYILGGHCVYGALAFEAARQLQTMGETTTLVALFDSWAPGYREDMSPLDRKLRQFKIDTVEHVKRLEQYRRGEVGLDAIVRKPILRRLGLLGPEPAPEKSSDLVFDDVVTDAAKTYRPAAYDGDVILFRSQETLRGRLFDDLMGWGPLVSGNLVKVEVDSAHQDMFRDRPARAIAAVLRARLDDGPKS